MTTEQIHDALSLLDNDLVAKVDVLRQQGRPKTSHPPRWGLLAACLCLILLSTFLLRPSVGPDGSSSTGMSPPITGASGGAAEPGGSKGNSSVAPGDPPSPSPGYGSGTIPGTDNASTGSTTIASNSLIVRVDSWQTGGFYGTILSEDGDTVFRPGQELLVLFSKDTDIIETDGSIFSYGEQDLGAETSSLPEGSLLLIEFESFEFNEITHTYDRIYAKSVMPKDLYDSRK